MTNNVNLKTAVVTQSEQKIQELENRLVEIEQTHQKRIDELNGQKDQEIANLRSQVESVTEAKVKID